MKFVQRRAAATCSASPGNKRPPARGPSFRHGPALPWKRPGRCTSRGCFDSARRSLCRKHLAGDCRCTQRRCAACTWIGLPPNASHPPTIAAQKCGCQLAIAATPAPCGQWLERHIAQPTQACPHHRGLAAGHQDGPLRDRRRRPRHLGAHTGMAQEVNGLPGIQAAARNPAWPCHPTRLSRAPAAAGPETAPPRVPVHGECNARDRSPAPSGCRCGGATRRWPRGIRHGP